MAGKAVRQVVLGHLAGKASLSEVVETDSAFDYGELRELDSTLCANDLHDMAGQLRYILEHLPPDALAGRRVFLVRHEDGSDAGRLVLSTKTDMSDPARTRTTVSAHVHGVQEGVYVRRADAGMRVSQYWTYVNQRKVGEGEIHGDAS